MDQTEKRAAIKRRRLCRKAHQLSLLNGDPRAVNLAFLKRVEKANVQRRKRRKRLARRPPPKLLYAKGMRPGIRRAMEGMSEIERREAAALVMRKVLLSYGYSVNFDPYEKGSCEAWRAVTVRRLTMRRDQYRALECPRAEQEAVHLQIELCLLQLRQGIFSPPLVAKWLHSPLKRAGDQRMHLQRLEDRVQAMRERQDV